jgi:choline dehydrogenase-like flavoprotein
LDASDFEQRDWVPFSGWPIRRDELVPYYQRAQRLCGLGEFLFYDADAIRPLLAHGPANVSRAVLETRIFQACPVLSFADLHRERLAATKNVEVMLATHAIRLKANRNGDRVIAVETVRTDGRPLHIEADTVILAAGGVENVRLLLCSNDKVRAGLGNVYDLVGRFFMDHPYFALNLADWKPSKEFRLYVGQLERVGQDQLLQTVGNARVWAQFVLSDQLKSMQRLPGIGLWFRPFPFIAPSVSALYRLANILHERVLPPSPLADIQTLLSDPVTLCRFFLRKLARTGMSRFADREGYDLMAEFELMPDPENRIRLSSHPDRFGQPEAELSLRIDDRQRQAHARALRIAAGELGFNGTALAREMELRLNSGKFGFFFHHIGTTRMSDDPRQGVVDRHCRVHGISNLFVAGTSVFPTGGAAPPTLTAVALAIRLADHILGLDGTAVT